jgi:hypothetical protein
MAQGRATNRFPDLSSATSPEEINHALLSHFFPSRTPSNSSTLLPVIRDVAVVTSKGVSKALSRFSNTSAPGPDGIPYKVWKPIHKGNNLLLPALLLLLLVHGFHPLFVKRATGFVLSRPGKPDYWSPASFRIIVLLETLSKILERIGATRLAE